MSEWKEVRVYLAECDDDGAGHAAEEELVLRVRVLPRDRSWRSVIERGLFEQRITPSIKTKPRH